MKPLKHSAKRVIYPFMGVAWVLATATPYAQAQQLMGAGTQILSAAAIASLCGGAGAAAGAGAAGAGALSGIAAMLCTMNGAPLQALTGMATSMLSQAMQGSGSGSGSGSTSTPQVSGLPVISQPTTSSFNANALNYNSVGSSLTPSAPKLPDYGVLVPQVAKREDFSTYNTVGSTVYASGRTPSGGGIRLPNGQLAREVGTRLGGFAEGTVVASNGVNVGTSVATVAGEQKIDWFTLGYDDGQNGRKKQQFADPSEQYQYDSGYALGQQYPLERPIV